VHCTACGHDNRDSAKFCGACATPLASECICSSCGTKNPTGQKFCDECGASLVASGKLKATSQSASASLTSNNLTTNNLSDARKVVTIVFADLIGSTSLHERLDAESVRRVMERYYRALQTAVENHGGTVVKLLGDGVMAAFGVPRVAEDDAIRAVRAAVEMVQVVKLLVVRRLGEGNLTTNNLTTNNLSIRVAVNTGEVVVSADNTDVVGDPVNVAARLQQEARDGEVLIGESTRRLVGELVTLEPAGVFTLKGRSESVAAYRVLSLERPAGAATTGFVGRDDELRRITAVYDAAVVERRARLAVVLGSPGLGKSRLLDEFGRRLGPSAEGFGPQAGDRATVLSARCEATGGSTFAPVAEAVRTFLRTEDSPGGVRRTTHERAPATAQGVALGSRLAALSGLRSIESVDDQQPQRGDQPIARGNAPGGGGATEDLRTAMDAVLADDADRDRIGAGIATLLAGTPAAPEETFFVIRRFLAALATNQPVVLAIDDLQWAEPLLLDLVEHLVQWGAGIPLLVLATARPDLRDVRSSLARTGELVSDVVTLAGLDAAAATQLAASVIGADALPAAVAGRVLATSEGNPLFVGELVRMLVADGVLKQEGDRWTAGVDLADLTMPPTIHALLAARIERLAAEDRTVLERAAVVGRQFSRAAVAHLLPAELRARLDARFEALRRSELIEPDTGWFLGEPALRFHHRLTRDAAYRRVLKGTRAELHARCADWIEGKVGDAIEHQETIGWHLEQAHQYARELGPIDSRGQAIGNRAAQYLAAAGRRALARDDVSVAADLLGRAVHVLNEADRARADLALDWCEALLAAGDVAHARGAIDELGRWTGETPSAPSPTHLLSVGEGRGEGASEGDASAAPSASGTLTLPSPALNKRAGEDSGRLRAWHTCFAGRLAVLTDPQSLHATATAVAAAADELAAAGDAAGEANAHLVHAMALSRLGKVGACEAALDKALAAAYAELDERYAAGEAAPYAHAWEWLPRLERAAAARDWEHWADVFAPDYVVEDHRVLGWGTLHSREEYMPYLRSLVDLVPDVKMRTDHVLALDDRGVLVIWRWLGSREGGPFEIPFVTVIGLGPDGRVQRSDIYDLEQLDEARAQFEELRVANSKHETRNSKQIRNSESE
jgi:class 3 adenylate cyclase